MGLYNFEERFASRIKLWAENPGHPDAKAHTIRAPLQQEATARG